MCECLRGRAECLFLDGRALGVVLGKAVDGSFLDPVFSAFLEQQQAWFNAKSIASFFWEATISGPSAISIWNETDVTRDIVVVWVCILVLSCFAIDFLMCILSGLMGFFF